MTVLHFFKLDKFIPPFIELTRKNFNNENHFFITTGDIKKYPYKEQSDSKHFYQKNKNLLKTFHKNITLIHKLHKSEKIIIHGLFSKKIILFLAFMPWLLPKCFWFIWGGDLYSYKLKKKSISSKWKELLKSIVIKKIGYLVTYIDGDVELARKWYKAKGTHLKSIMYLSNTFSPLEIKKQKSKFTKILLGNSANPSNNHSEILKKLSHHQNLKIYTPLSYGDKKNAKKINQEGKTLFGENFIPLNNFMPLEEYKILLGNIDIAIFNHNRQQGMGNIISLLGLGKTVYIRSDVTPWPFFKEKGITLADSIDIKLEKLPETILAKNSKIVQESFSESVLVKELEIIFNTKI